LHGIKVLFIVYLYLLLHRRSKKLELRGKIAPKNRKLKPKTENRSGLLEKWRAVTTDNVIITNNVITTDNVITVSPIV